MPRFSSAQVTVMVVAVCVALGPVTVMAATGQLVNITDPQNTSEKARVDGTKLRVGDGDGRMSVDGTVAAAMAVPARPFQKSLTIDNQSGVVALVQKGSRDRLALTSLTVSATGDANYSIIEVTGGVVDHPSWNCANYFEAPLVSDQVFRVTVTTKPGETDNVTWPSPAYAFQDSRDDTTSCLWVRDAGSPGIYHQENIQITGFWG